LNFSLAAKYVSGALFLRRGRDSMQYQLQYQRAGAAVAACARWHHRAIADIIPTKTFKLESLELAEHAAGRCCSCCCRGYKVIKQQ
jgi:hypothetical protein